MASQGPLSPNSAVNDDEGATSWSNESNITDDTSSYASANLLSAGWVSDLLIAHDFGFDIPENAVIDGIQVQWHKARVAISGGATVTDQEVRIGKYALVVETPPGDDFTRYGDDKASADIWPHYISEGPATSTYGGSGDDWNAAFTPADINDTSFAVGLSVKSPSGTNGGRIYWVKVTVYYTPAASVSNIQSITNVQSITL